jgi:hypothetical protein
MGLHGPVDPEFLRLKSPQIRSHSGLPAASSPISFANISAPTVADKLARLPENSIVTAD